MLNLVWIGSGFLGAIVLTNITMHRKDQIFFYIISICMMYLIPPLTPLETLHGARTGALCTYSRIKIPY